MMNITDQENFCMLPWLGATSTTKGQFRPCCDYQLHNQEDPTLVTHWSEPWKNNIEGMNKLRADFIAGKKPSGCRICWLREQNGSRSRREKYNIHENIDKFKDKINSTGNDGSTDILPIFVDLKLGNLCNLGCRMCNPVSSTVIQAEVNNNKEEWTESDLVSAAKNFTKGNWHEVSLDKVLQLEQVTSLKFTGGEPFANPKIFDFLKTLIELDRAKDIRIEFISNGLLINDNALELLEFFKSVKLMISCDGIFDSYEYIRWPGKWKDFDDKFTKITKKFKVNVATIISAYNVYYMPEIYNYFKDKAEWSTEFLIDPAYLRPFVFPTNVSQGIKEKLQNFDHIPGIKEILNLDQKFDEELYSTFKKQTLIKDKLRKQSFGESLKEVAKLFEPKQEFWK